MKHPHPLVSICIPAFKCDAFIEPTVQSALSQTHPNIEIKISVDGPERSPVLDRLSGLPDIQVVYQTKHLGWVENTNAALSLAKGDFFMVLPHDDRIAPTYVESCLKLLTENPDAFATTSYIEAVDIDKKHREIWQFNSISGTSQQRFTELIKNRYNGYFYRALMRRNPSDWENLKMLPNGSSNFCCDTTWMFQQAQFGELLAVPEVFYFKTLSETTEHTGWGNLSKRTLRKAWREHCRQIAQILEKQYPSIPGWKNMLKIRRDPSSVKEAPDYIKPLFWARSLKSTFGL